MVRLESPTETEEAAVVVAAPAAAPRPKYLSTQARNLLAYDHCDSWQALLTRLHVPQHLWLLPVSGTSPLPRGPSLSNGSGLGKPLAVLTSPTLESVAPTRAGVFR